MKKFLYGMMFHFFSFCRLERKAAYERAETDNAISQYNFEYFP